ncbi:carbohydrate kinase family protein [Opitutaceae bacterium TAV4]|nr:carbohydrate kinase family protein [Opitutaceae bacterium TAV4]RRK00612.1 carbohydrate kinase family protein [Opitutaceae bacterium TAV3]
MSFQQRVLQELSAARERIKGKNVVVGLDGFVDTIVTPVAQRTGQGDAFTAIETITEFGQRVLSAAGKSTNIEFYPRMEKLGGNGPIMANALLAAGSALTYIGAIGKDNNVHPIFADMAARSRRTITLCEPAATTAVEFHDGKLMLGQMKSLDEITYPRLLDALGEDGLIKLLATADLVALVNWTMIPNMTGVFKGIADHILPRLPAAAARRIFFFDLADPEKRSVHDLLEALEIIGRFEQHGSVTLGLNFKEAQQVYAALGLGLSESDDGNDEKALRHMASAIRQKLALSTVVVHPRASAACATSEGDYWLPGPFCEKPLITTGAGDHFNAGFSTGQLLGLSPEACLGIGVCTSGHYVRSAHSPSLADLETFLARWR